MNRLSFRISVVFALIISGMIFFSGDAHATTDTFNSGSSTWTVPSGVTSVQVQLWAAGGGGGAGKDGGSSGGSAGAGGGQYTIKTLTVTPGQSISYSVGAGGAGSIDQGGGAPGTNGGNSTATYSAVTYTAHGGTGGQSGFGVPTVGGAGGTGATGGDTTYDGGAGAAKNSNAGGGGGSSAGTASVGTTATTITGAVAPTGGGNGGDGGVSQTSDGSVGSAPGGAGGGGGKAQNGGAGAAGRVSFTYTASGPATYTWTGTTNTDWGTGTNWDLGTVPTSTDNVVIANTTNKPLLDINRTTNNLTINTSAILDLNGKNLTMTGTFSNSGTLKLQGGETLSGFTNDATHGTIQYYGTSSYAGLAAGNAYNNLTFNGSGGTWTLNSGLTVSSTGTVTLTNGTLNLNNQNVSMGFFAVGSGTKTLTLGSGTTTLTGAGTVWDTNTNSSGLTVSATTGTIKITDTSNTANTFAGGGKTFNNIWWSRGGSTASNTTSGSNTFADFKDDGSAAHSLLFAAGSTTTVTTFTVSGSSGNVITLDTDTGASTFTLSDTSGSNIVTYTTINRSTGSGGAAWIAKRSTNGSSNTGWVFGTTAVAAGGNWSATGTWDTGVVPTASTNVFLDATSGNVTIDAASVARSLDATGYTGTLTHNAFNLTLGDSTAGAGNVALKLAAGMTYTVVNVNTSALVFVSTSATQQTITTGTKVTGAVTINSATGNYQLQDNWSIGAGLWTFSNAGCTWDSNGKSITIAGSGSTFAGGGKTYADFISNAGSLTVISGNNTFANVTMSTSQITGSNTFNNLTVAGTITLSANQTINGVLTVDGSPGTGRAFVTSDVLGTPRTITIANTPVIDNTDFRDITGAGAGSWNLSAISGDSGDAGGNSGITFTTAATQYWKTTTTGTKTWATAGNWFLATNGGGGAGRIPLPQDDVVFDANSIGAASTTIQSNMSRIGKSITFSGVTNSPTWSNTVANTLYGSLTLVSGMSVSGTNVTTFEGRSSYTITSAGKTFTQGLTFTAFGGTYLLADALITNGSMTISNGTFDAQNTAVNANVTIGVSFFSNSGFTRTVTMGSGTWSVLGNATNIWITSTAGFTLNRGNAVQLTYSGSTGTRSISSSTVEANSPDFAIVAGSDGFSFSSGTAVRNIDFTGFTGTLTNTSYTIYGNITYSSGMTITGGVQGITFSATSGTKTITTNGKTLDVPLAFSGIGGTWQLADNLTVGSTRTVTLNNGTIDANGKDFSMGAFSSSTTNTRAITFGSGVWSITGNNTTVWNADTVTGLTVNRGNPIRLTYSGSTGTRTIGWGLTSGSESNALDFSITAGSDIFSINDTRIVRSLDFTGFSGAWTEGVQRPTIYGNLTLSATMTHTAATGTITFAATSSKTITTNGVTIDAPITFSGVGGTWQLADNFTVGSTRTVTLTNGTLDANGKNFSMGAFSSSNSNTRTINLGSGTWSITGPGSAWNITTSTGLTITPGTSTIKFTDTSTGGINFIGGSLAYNNIWWSRGASTGSNIVVGSNTFNNFKDDGSVAHSVLFTTGTTTTVGTWTVRGASGNLITINSTTTGTHALNAKNVLAYWKFDEGSGTNAADSSGYGNTATLANGTTWDTSVPSAITFTDPSGVAFDGTNDSVTFSGVATTTTFTYSAWIKPNSQVDSYGALLANNPTTFGLFYRGSGAGASAGKISYYYATDHLSSATLTDGAWNHVAVSVSAGNVTLYVNGVASGTYSGANAFTAAVMGDDSGSETFKGSMDDVRIYNYSMSASEVATLSGGSAGQRNNPLMSSDYVNIQHSVATPANTWYAGANSTNNQATTTAGSGWIFSTPTTCTAFATGNWNTSATWDCGHVPSAGDAVIIPVDVTVTMDVASAVLGAVTINGTLNTSDGTSRALNVGGVLTVASGGTLTANASTITLSGTSGTPFVKSGTFTVGTSTVAYTGNNGSGNTTITNIPYANLQVNNASETYVLAATTTVSNNLTITAGTLDTVSGSNFGLSVGGNWSNSGTFTSRSGTVTLTSTSGSATLASGGSSFYNLTQNGSGGTYTLQDALPVSNTLTISAGTLDVSASNYGITVGANFSNAGTFTKRSGTVTFNASLGATQSITSGGTSFYGLTHSGAGILQPADALTVTNALTNSAGVFSLNGQSFTATGATISNTAIIQAQGGETITGFSNDTTHGTIVYTGTSNRTGLNLGNTYNNLTINDGLVGYWKLDEGTGSTAADSSGYGNTGTLINSPTWTSSVASGIAFTDPYALSFTHTATQYVNAGDITAMNSASKLTLSAWMKRTASGNIVEVEKNIESTINPVGLEVYSDGKVYFNLSTNNYGTITQADTNWHLYTLVFDGTQTGNANRLKGFMDGVQQTLTFGGAGTIPSTTPNMAGYSLNIGKIRYSGAAETFSDGSIDDVRVYNRSLTSTEVSSLGNGTQPGSAIATYTLNNALTVNGDVVLASGAIDVSASNYGITNGGSWYNYGGTLNPRAGTVTLSSTSTGKALQSGGQSFQNLTFNGSGGGWTLADAVTASGNLTITNGTLDVSTSNYAMSVGGNYSNAGTFTARSGTVTLTSTSSGATLTSGGNSFYNLTQNGSGGTYTLQDGLTTSNNLTITAGTLDVSSSNYALAIGGNYSNSGTFTKRSGTVTFNKASGTQTLNSGGSSFYNLTHSGAGTLQLVTNAVTIANNLINSAGIFDANGLAVNVAGNLNNNGGTYTANGNTLTLNGTNQSVLGSATFYNLVKTVSSAATLTFEAAKTQTVAGLFTLQGAANNLLSLVSSIPGSQWFFNPVSAVLSYLNIQDANNSNATPVTANNSQNSGNNTNIIFSATTVTWTGTTNTDWGTATNWDVGYVPNSTDNVVIPNTTNKPLLDLNRTVNNLTINDPSAILDLNGKDLTMTGAFSNTGTLKLQGGETLTGFTNDATHGTILYYGTSTYTTLHAGNTYNNVTFSGTGGNWAAASSTTVNGVATVTAGTLTTGVSGGITTSATGTTISIGASGTLTNNGSLSIAGAATPILNAGTWTNSSTSTVTYTGQSDNAGVTVPNVTYGNVVFNKTGTTFTLAAALTAAGNLTITAGTLDVSASNYGVTVGGNFSNSGIFTKRSGTVTLNGSGTQTFNTGSSSFYDIVHSGSGAVQLSGSALTITHSLTNSAGIFGLNGQNFTTTGATISNTATIQAQGGEVVTGFTNDATHGTILYNGSGSYTGFNLGNSYNNLAFNGTGTWTLNASPSIASNLIITAGTLSLAGNNLAVPGTFTTGGTLMLNGTETSITTPTNLTAAGTIAYNNTIPIGSFYFGNTYNHLTLQGTGAVTLNAALTTNGNLAIASGATLDFNGYDPTIGGDFVNAGTVNGASTRTFTLNGVNQILNTANTVIKNLLLTGSSGTVSLGSNATISDLISIAAGRVFSLVTYLFTGQGTITNLGTINNGSGTFAHTSSGLYFANSDFDASPVYSVPAEKVYLSITDSNRNLDGQNPDSFSMTVTAPHDSETVTMTETGNATGIFRNNGLTTALYTGSASTNNGTLSAANTDTISTSYTDAYDSGDTRSATATISSVSRASAPSSLAGTPLSSTSIRWTWTDNANNETGFKLYDGSGTLIATIATPNTTSYTETGLAKGTNYTRKVVAYNDAGDSLYSNTVTVMTPAEPTAPSSFTGVSVSNSSIAWTWSDNSNDEDGFKLLDGDGATVATIATPNTTSYTETGLVKGTSYTRKIVAYNSDGTSSASNSATVTTGSANPGSFGLLSPADNALSGTGFPTFSFQKSIETGGSISSYTLYIGSRSFTGIPASGSQASNPATATDYENTYTAQYFSEGDSDATNDTISVTLKSSALADGKYSWYVKAIDDNGNTTVSSSRTITIDATKPVIGNFVFSGSTLNPTLSTTVTDNRGLHEATVTLERATKLFGAVTSYTALQTRTYALSGTSGSISFTAKNGLTAGQSYRYTITVSDSAGHETSASSTRNVLSAQQEAQHDVQTLNPDTTPTDQIVTALRGTLPASVFNIPQLEARAVVRRQLQAAEFNKLTARIVQYLAAHQGPIQRNILAFFQFIGSGMNAATHRLALLITGYGEYSFHTSRGWLAGIGDQIHSARVYIASIDVGTPLQHLAQYITIRGTGTSNAFVAFYNSGVTTLFTISGNTFNATMHGIARIDVGNFFQRQLAFLSHIFSTSRSTRIAQGLSNRQLIDGYIHRIIDPMKATGTQIALKGRAMYEIAFDKQPTKISNLAMVNLSPTTVTVTWDTNHLTHLGKVNYGTSTSYNQEAFEANGLRDHHEVTLDNLNPKTTYYFEVMNQNGGYVYDAYYTVTTPSSEEQVPAPTLIPQDAVIQGTTPVPVYASPDPLVPVIKTLFPGTILRALKQQDGWVSVLLDSGQEVWLRADTVKLQDHKGASASAQH